MSNRDIPEFTAATLPPPQQWGGRTIWRSDLLCHQTSTGLEWRGEVTQDPRTGLLYAGGVPVAVPGMRTLTLEQALTDTVLARLPDGRYLGTSNDSTGGFGGKLWAATGSAIGAQGSLTRAAIASTNAAALKNTLGTTLGSGVIQNCWALSTGDILFVASDGSSRASLFYGKAGGGTWTVGANAGSWNDSIAVVDLGRIGGSHTANVRQLSNRSLCQATIGGSTVLLFGEYNVASGRVAGSTNDQCRVLKSTDGGQTWTALLTWNTDGSTSQMRHVHAVRQDPVTGYIYFMIGDNPWSSLIRWDGVSSAPPANTSMANFANYSGWAVLPASEWYRSGDLLFAGNGAHYLVDNTSVGDYKRAMSVSRTGTLYSSKGRPVDVSAYRDPLIAADIPGGGALWLSMWDTGIGAVRGHDVWSTVDYQNWVKIGYIQDVGSGGTVGVLQNVFFAEDRLIVTQCSGSAKLVAGAYGGSLVFNIDSFFDGVQRVLS